ncbi:MAG: DNA repair protein RadC [Hydrogenophilales bacterium]|nr:DNA repair protein RadC [Hydrogenophilales bacterium]
MPLSTRMSDLDLLGALVGPHTAENLLTENGGSLYQLFGLSAVDHRVSESVPMDGWSRARYLLDVARELVARGFNEALRGKDALTSPDAVRSYLVMSLSHLPHEVFMVLFLDAQNRLIAARECFRGTLTQTSVYPREVVKIALEYNASSVVLCHNHPSGAAEPSQADRWLTDQLRQALALVDIKVLDHFIVACNRTLSFAERGLI